MIDKELLKTINEMDDYNRKQLLALDKDLAKVIKKHTRGDGLVDVPGLLREMDRSTAAWAGAFVAGIIAYNVLAARRSLDQQHNLMLGTFKKNGGKVSVIQRALNQLRDNQVAKTQAGILTRKWPGTTITLAARIKTVEKGAQTVVRNLIQQGLKEGKSSYDIAKDISSYVTPNAKGLRVAPWTITRRALGKPVSYIPKKIPAGSVEYNAFRIARAEAAETYHQAPYLAHKDKWYYNGTKWHLSRSHPKKDVCDEYAAHNEGIGKGVWRKCPKLPHPHCLCWTETLMVDPEEMASMLKKVNWI